MLDGADATAAPLTDALGGQPLDREHYWRDLLRAVGMQSRLDSATGSLPQVRRGIVDALQGFPTLQPVGFPAWAGGSPVSGTLVNHLADTIATTLSTVRRRGAAPCVGGDGRGPHRGATQPAAAAGLAPSTRPAPP
jgi:hypothetical protein